MVCALFACFLLHFLLHVLNFFARALHFSARFFLFSGGHGAEQAGVRVQGGEEHAAQDRGEEGGVRRAGVGDLGEPAQAHPVSGAGPESNTQVVYTTLGANIRIT